jgi:fatty acid desaturase
MTPDPISPISDSERLKSDLRDERRLFRILAFTAPMGFLALAGLAVGIIFEMPPWGHILTFVVAVIFGILMCAGLYQLVGLMDRGQESISLNPHGRDKKRP